jgi:hypothetical protein
LINMIFLRAFVELEVDIELDDSYLFDARNISNKTIKKYIDDKIIIPFINDFTETEERFIKVYKESNSNIYYDKETLVQYILLSIPFIVNSDLHFGQ